jgi:hypothetical protein
MDSSISFDRTQGIGTEELRLARVTGLVHRYLYMFSAVRSVVSCSDICVGILNAGPNGALESPTPRMVNLAPSGDYHFNLDDIKAALKSLHAKGLVLTDVTFDFAAINENGLSVLEGLPVDKRPFRFEKSTWRS